MFIFLLSILYIYTFNFSFYWYVLYLYFYIYSPSGAKAGSENICHPLKFSAPWTDRVSHFESRGHAVRALDASISRGLNSTYQSKSLSEWANGAGVCVCVCVCVCGVCVCDFDTWANSVRPPR